MSDADLSKLLFEARDAIEILADLVEARVGKPSTHERQLVERIDAYRAERGWNPDGFGQEGAK